MSQLVTALTLIFVSASVLIFILDRFSHPTIPAYILAGILVGGFIPEQEILNFAEIGIAFLVFIFGVKTDLGRISKVAEESISTALIQIIFVGTTVFLVTRGLGFNLENTLYLSAAAALSSSLVGMNLIESEVRINLLRGRLAEAIQLIQDLFALLVITLLGTEFTFQQVSLNIGYLVIVIGAALFVRQYLFEAVAKRAEGSREILMMTSLGILTGFISLSHFTGAPLVIGSFAAGLAVAKFPYNMEVLDTMGSLKDFFSAIFFVALGALITVPGPMALLLTSLLISTTFLLKPLITGISLMISGYDKRTAYLTGLSLDQVSEFALIIAIQAYLVNSIEPVIFQSIILAATITMITTSYTSRFEEKIYQITADYGLIDVNNRKINEKTSIPENIQDHVILIGYDTQGKEIANALKEENKDFLIIDNDPERIAEISQDQDYYVFGDVMDHRTWQRSKATEATLIVSTIPQTKISEKILSIDTEADKILRASEPGQARKLLEDGATYVNVPDLLSSEELVEHLKGVMENVNYRSELRRRNLLDIRKYLHSGEE